MQNNREQILLSKKLATIHCDVPVEFSLESVIAQEPEIAALRELYKTLEFSSLLREVGPAATPAKDRDYQTLENESALEEWFATLPADVEIAVAAGEMMSETVLGFSAQRNQARTVVLDKIPPRATVAHDVKALARRFGDSASLKHDVMLYGFLVSSDPGRCDLQALAERYLDVAIENDPARSGGC